MADIPFWATKDGAKAWDTLIISGTPAPGLVKISGKFSQDLETKKPKGQKAAIIRYNGDEPSEFSITIRIWTAQQTKDLVALLGRIKTKKGETPTAFDVYHPALECAEIRSMYVKEFTFLEEGSERHVYETRWSCLEFLPLPAKGKGKGKTSKATTDIRTLDNPISNAFGNIPLFGDLISSSAQKIAEVKAPSADPKKTGP
jgi:hypothetical protein